MLLGLRRFSHLLHFVVSVVAAVMKGGGGDRRSEGRWVEELEFVGFSVRLYCCFYSWYNLMLIQRIGVFLFCFGPGSFSCFENDRTDGWRRAFVYPSRLRPIVYFGIEP